MAEAPPVAQPSPDGLAPDAAAAIVTLHLTKQYGAIHAVQDLSISVPAGVICGFVGPNGSGKTTTIRMLLGQVHPTGGSATILGTPIEHPRDILPAVGALVEGPTFYPGLSGRDNLRVLASLGGFSRARVDEVLEIVGLRARARDQVRRYSLGMRQRLGVAAALLPDPRLLILDEPANGLDPEGIIEMRSLLRGFRAEGRTIFVSSHLLGELEQMADWLVAIRNGTLMYAGRTEDMLTATSAVLIVAPEHSVDAERVATLAQQLGREAHFRDGKVHVAKGTDIAATLNREAMKAGITLVEMQPQQASLEESFLAMIEGGQ